MSFTSTPVSAASFIPLSASYAYDSKMSLNPTLHQYEDGYAFFHHPLFIGSKDSKFANDSFFSITSSATFGTFANDTTYINPLDLVLFMSFRASNGKYITNTDNTLYATATSISDTEFFRVAPNTDGTYSISQNDLYATVVTEDQSFVIEMQDKVTTDTNAVQKFTIDNFGSGDDFTIKTQFTIDAWASLFPAPIERFWSYYDSTDDNTIKAIGMIEDDDYTDENNYVFSGDTDLDAFAVGFDGKIKWVKYYNDTLTKLFNKNVDIKDTIEDIEQNFLIEYPYKTKVDVTNYQDLVKAGSIQLNVSNLKSILTPEYDVAVKKE
tara:strand:+ start:3012 stop:3980 length:969 start_codon:yes stop_codon:yes gene_type:complete